MNKQEISINPSIMCADLCNLEKSIRQIEKEGISTLHIDVIDGSFSPSMPLGIGTIKQLREITDMDFDVHIMSNNNEFFIKEMLDIGVQQITFHYESTTHIDRLLNLIKKNGVEAGLALNPATSLNDLDYVLPLCDTVMLMLMNPGFAADKSETQVDYAEKKVTDLYKLIKDRGLDTSIEVDGRVSLEAIPKLVKSGADQLVAGSTSLFRPERSMSENKVIMEESIEQGLKLRKE
ncbi:Pentose-5-phosphate-3-epimerase [Halobacteroides halobius DSM 5150]|uniref:Pentose-5-phosphate-3-epimerase n=1 Tax=Halobacteroides halobius (strain ATCC 35273 / DSM 5150 / MD-1) TaxID=748449 RepID=L0KA65_HALHC|nr:ribulose-phosphate 3-epimerase [Halobacteroides halobius]AGB42197.1 Pentose-5-phosphate-3-epimerase [Halobacteroides halobius DSM 5150]